MDWGKIVLTLLVCPVLAIAQVNGRITGTVIDASGAAVAGAAVEVRIPGGAQAILATKSNSEGLFVFPAVRPDTYDVVISMAGFAQYVGRRIKVDTLGETSLGEVRLEVSATSEVIEVTAPAQTVQLTGAELTTTVTREQIQDLPAFGRQVSALFTTQAGVSDGRGDTVINGLRTSAANVTLDGINIQDNFIRTNSLDFMPIRPTIEQIAEVGFSVGNAGTTVGGGAAQISMTTQSGSNEFHGSAYWQNRNSKFSANEWFSNRSGIEVPFLNLNQPGGSLSGRIIPDKLFFFGNYEEFRLKEQDPQLRVVLTPEARQGIFRCARCAQSVNVLTARQTSVDSAIAPLLQAVPLPNSTDAGDGRNTSGYRFNARANMFRRQMVGRVDYYLSPTHNVSGTVNFTKEDNDRPDITDQFYTAVPPNGTATDRYFTSMAWRWTASPTITNDLRGGFLRSPSKFVTTGAPQFHLGSTLFDNPVNDFMPQGRFTNTYSIQDNASWLKGKHELSFGFQSQFIRIQPYNDGGIVPTLTLGISTANTTGFVTADIPGATAGDVNVANRLYTSLAGIVSSADQSFNVTNRTSGFVPGAGEVRNFSYDTWAGYLQDKWKLRRNLTLTFGLRYEYWTVLKEKDNLWLLPELRNGNVITTLLDPLANFDFVGVGNRSLYKPDRNNFAPSVGFAWDPFGNGKTAVRGGYSIAYFNDDTVTAIRNNANTNQGLNSTAVLNRLTARASSGITVPTPPFRVPRTQADNYAASPTAALGSPDPNLQTPYAQEWSLGVQHDVRGNVIEVRYVGNRGTQLLRAFDYNQVVIRENGFLDDFVRARNNGLLSLQATGRFNPAYTGAGTQPLTVFPRLGGGGLLGNATVQRFILQAEPGELGNIYQTNRLNGTVNFYRNRNALGANVINSGGNSTYHALQVDFRRRFQNNLTFQANYTYGKVLSDNVGNSQARFDPYLDLGNPSLERARPPFDLTHAIKANGTYTLPFGKNQRWSSDSAILNHIVGGWAVSGVLTWQSGFPFSVLSNRGTLNRGGRSTAKNTASTNLTKSELESRVFGLRKQGDGVFLVDRGVINTDRRAVASDGAAPFSGQVFFNPGAGSVGGLQRRMFSGPWALDLNMSVQKRFAIGEKQRIEFRANAYNMPNHPTFTFGDQNINSTAFGRLTSTLSDARVWEFAIFYRF